MTLVLPELSSINHAVPLVCKPPKLPKLKVEKSVLLEKIKLLYTDSQCLKCQISIFMSGDWPNEDIVIGGLCEAKDWIC